jgi:hypothetical protein
MNTVASNLKTAIDNHASYEATVSGSTITVTDGAGAATITVTAKSFLPAGAIAGSTTEAGRTVNLSGMGVVADRVYRITIDSAVFSYTAQAGNTLQDVATQLKNLIDAHATYGASLRSVTISQSWTAVLNELDSRIEAGEPVTGTPTAGSYKLSLEANVANTPFTVDSVGVTSATAVTSSGSTATVKAAAGVAQQNVIDYGDFALQTSDAFTIVLDGTAITVSAGTKEVAVQTTPTAAAAGVAQVSHLTYITLNSAYAYTAIVGQNYYEARVGSVVNGTTVVATWDSILEALRFQIAAGESAVTVSADVANHRIVLTAKAVNTPFDVLGSEVRDYFMCKTWSGLLSDLQSALENVIAGTAEKTTNAGASSKQVSELTFDNDPIKTGYCYTVTVDFRDYTATVGQSGVTADWSSILGKLVSLIAADGNADVTAVSDAANRKLIVTAKEVNPDRHRQRPQYAVHHRRRHGDP